MPVELYHGIWELLSVEEYRFREAYCLESAGETLEALAIFRELAESDRSEIVNASGERIEALEQLLADLPAYLRVLTDQLGATITVDELTSRLANEPEVVFEVSAAEHHIAIQLDGYETEQHSVVVDPGEEVELSVVLTQIAEPTEADLVFDEPLPPPVEDDNLLIPILLGSVAVAAVGSGIVFGVLAENAVDDAWAYDMTQPGSTSEAQLLLNERADDFVLASNISFASAGALAVGAILVLIFDDDEVASTEVSIVPGAERIGAQLSWEF